MVNSSGVPVIVYQHPPDESGGYAKKTPPEL